MARMERGEGCSEPSGSGLAEEEVQSQQDSTAHCRRLCKAPAPQLCSRRFYYLHHRVVIIALIFLATDSCIMQQTFFPPSSILS